MERSSTRPRQGLLATSTVLWGKATQVVAPDVSQVTIEIPDPQ
jgi:hypothetical protein